MIAPAPSVTRHLVAALALAVPLVVDPWGVDTLSAKRLLAAVLGLLALGFEALEVLAWERRRAAPSAVEVLLALFGTWAALSLLWAANPWVGVPVVVTAFGALGLLRTVRTARVPPAAWFSALLLVGVLTAAVDGRAVLARAPLQEAGAEKYASLLFVHNNIAASFVAVLLPVAAALLLGGPSGRRRVLGALALTACAADLLLLRSRASVLASLGGLLLVGALFVLRRRLPSPRLRRNLLLGVLLVGALAALVPLSERGRGLAKDAYYRVVLVLDRIGVSDLQDSSFRPAVFSRTIDLARESPLTGTGAGNFAVQYPRYEPHTQERPHAHNDALQALAELGLPGLLLFVALLGAAAATCLSALGATANDGRFAQAAGASGGLLVFAITGLFEVPFTQGATVVALAFLLGGAGRLAGQARPVAAFAGRAASRVALVVAAAGVLLLAWRAPASFLVARATAAEARGDLAAARRDWQAAGELPTGAPEPWRQLARLSLTGGEADGALEHVRRARALAPHSVELLQAEGRVLMALQRPGEAVALLERAVQRRPGDLDALYELVHALDRAGRRREAIAILEHQAQARLRDVSPGVIMQLANLWRAEAQAAGDEARLPALVSARHFYAVFLEDGPLSGWRAAHEAFKHVTHQLQSLPGSPDCWWPAYERFLRAGGWRMPATALWTALDADGKKLYPGWEEPAGPPRPRRMRVAN